MSHQEQKEMDDDNSSITTDDFVQLGQTTENSSVLEQERHGSNPLDLSSTSLAISDGNDGIKELQLKMTSLEAKNITLEAKVKDLELKAQIYELKEENMALKLKEAEQKAQMATSQLEQEKVKFEREIAILKGQLQQHEKQQLTYKLQYTIYAVRVKNPNGDSWEGDLKHTYFDSSYGHQIESNSFVDVFAERAFSISGKLTSGKIVNYYEVTRKLTLTDDLFHVGFVHGPIPADEALAHGCSNSDCIQKYYDKYNVYSAGKGDLFVWLSGAIQLECIRKGDAIVAGCGILVNSKNELAIFFTANGIVVGEQFPLKQQEEEVVRLYPAISFWGDEPLVTNFGNGSSNSFKYDIEKCPGLDFK